MRILLKLEFAALFVLSLFLFSMLPYAWWWYPAFILVPDIGMLGYLVDPRLGAMTYNLTHWLVLGVALNIIGHTAGLQPVALAGVIIVGHSALDRVLGFGLKYPDSFRHTHLGSL